MMKPDTKLDKHTSIILIDVKELIKAARKGYSENAIYNNIIGYNKVILFT